jgi:hypothetical protein
MSNYIKEMKIYVNFGHIFIVEIDLSEGPNMIMQLLFEVFSYSRKLSFDRVRVKQRIRSPFFECLFRVSVEFPLACYQQAGRV